MIKTPKRIIKLGILIFAIIGFFYIFNPGDISPLSLPCPNKCGNQMCGFNTIMIPKDVSCELTPFHCARDCRMRNFKCGVDPEFQQQCVDCTNECLQSFDQTDPEQYEPMMECQGKCVE